MDSLKKTFHLNKNGKWYVSNIFKKASLMFFKQLLQALMPVFIACILTGFSQVQIIKNICDQLIFYLHTSDQVILATKQFLMVCFQAQNIWRYHYYWWPWSMACGLISNFNTRKHSSVTTFVVYQTIYPSFSPFKYLKNCTVH